MKKTFILFCLFLPGLILAQEAPGPGDLIITEFMQDPDMVSDTKGEWVELFNASESVLRLNDLILKDDGSNEHKISGDEDILLSPGEYFVLGREMETSSNGGLVLDYKYTNFSLGNSEDEIIICLEDGQLIDQVVYSASNDWPLEKGCSCALLQAQFSHSANDEPANWFNPEDIYGDGDHGTPGRENQGGGSSYIQIISPNGGESYSVGNEAEILWDSEGIDGGIKIELFLEQVSIAVLAENVENTGSWLWYISSDLEVSDQYQINLESVEHSDIHDLSAGTFEILTGGEPECTLIITEVMQNPSAVSDTKGEWFELYNTGDQPFCLDHYVLCDLNTNRHVIEPEESLVVGPGEFLVLGNNEDTQSNGGVSLDYQYSSFSLGNSADEIIILSPDEEQELVRLEYDGGPDWPDPNGASMELDNSRFSLAEYNDGSYWHESSEIFGDGDYGTPGQINSTRITEEFEIVGQPDDMDACQGARAMFTVSACGPESLYYQWKKDGEEMQNEKSAILSFSGVDFDDEGDYSCVITCGDLEMCSGDAHLNVHENPVPDLGADTVYTSDPVSVILNAGDYELYYWNDDPGTKSYQVQNYGWVHLKVSNGYCFGMDSVFISPATGKSEQEIQYMEPLIYPNPSKGLICIKWECGMIGGTCVEVYNMQGKCILFREFITPEERLYLQEKGLMILKVITGSKLFVRKVLIM